MDLQLVAIIATVWIATGLTRFIMMRPVSRLFRDTMCGLYLDMGMTADELANSKYLTGMKIAGYFELLTDLILAPWYLIRERTRFFLPASRELVQEQAVHTFRKTVYGYGEHVEMLEAYEARLIEEAREEHTGATFH